MRCSILALLLTATIESAFTENYDNCDLTGNLSQWVQYGELTEEEKKFTLEYLTTDTGAEWEREAEMTMTATEIPNEETTTTTGIQEEQATTEFDAEEAATEISQNVGNQTQREARIAPVSTAAALGDYPYYVLLTITTNIGTTTYCGGAIISDSWILTAAQCVVTATAIKVDAGLILAAGTPVATSAGIATIHPGFKKNLLIHDIALVRLLTPYTLSANVAPIKLVKKDYHGTELNSVTVRTMGFGAATNAASPPSTAFSYVDLINMNKVTCKTVSKTIFVEYPATTSCLYSSTNLQGFCLGDVGGPVVYRFPSDIDISLLGLNSIYQSCPSSYPSAYTRIGPYYHWIKSKVPKILTKV